jgi:hypothetical protein
MSLSESNPCGLRVPTMRTSHSPIGDELKSTCAPIVSGARLLSRRPTLPTCQAGRFVWSRGLHWPLESQVKLCLGGVNLICRRFGAFSHSAKTAKVLERNLRPRVLQQNIDREIRQPELVQLLFAVCFNFPTVHFLWRSSAARPLSTPRAISAASVGLMEPPSRSALSLNGGGSGNSNIASPLEQEGIRL